MGIGEQFAGLDMANLIGGPLTAAADASVLLAHSTADFINEVGFDADNKTRTASFNFTRMEPDEDGSVSQSEMKVEVPLLAIVPIPNLQIDEVNILFDMEVKQCEKSSQSLDMGAKINAGLKVGPLKVNISGSVASHSENTRSSDNSAKYHVDVSATNHGTPEGLARVLDMMAANVAPTLVSSKAVDESGNELDGARKERNKNMRALREKKFQHESAVRAASEIFDSKMKAILEKASNVEDAERLVAAKIKEGATEEETKAAEETMDKIDAAWGSFKNSIKSVVTTAAGNAVSSEGAVDEAAFGELSEKIEIFICEPYDEAAGTAIKTDMQGLYKDAVNACIQLKKENKAMDDNNNEYNKEMLKI